MWDVNDSAFVDASGSGIRCSLTMWDVNYIVRNIYIIANLLFFNYVGCKLMASCCFTS